MTLFITLCILVVHHSVGDLVLREGSGYMFMDNHTEPHYQLADYLSGLTQYWSHSVLSGVVQQAILALMDPLPYSAIFGANGTFEPDVGVLMYYEFPLLFPSFIAFEIATITPIVTILFLLGLLRCKCCRGKKKSPERPSHRSHRCLSVLVVIASLTTGIFIFFLPGIGERMWKLPKLLSRTAHQTISDMESFKLNLEGNIYETIVLDLYQYMTSAKSEVRRVAGDVASVVVKDINEGYLSSTREFYLACTKAQSLIRDIRTSQVALIKQSRQFGSQIYIIRYTMETIIRQCNFRKYCGSLLNSMNVEEFRYALAKITHLDSIVNTTALMAVNSTELKNITESVTQSITQHIFNNYPNLTSNISDIERSIHKFDYYYRHTVRQVEWGKDKVPLKEYVEGVDTMRRYGEIHSYQRAAAVYGVSLLMLVFAVSAVVMVILGTRVGEHNTSMSRAANRCAVFVLGYGSLFNSVIYVITIIGFLAGTHLQLVCRSIADKSAFTDYIDKPSIWGNKLPIGHVLYGPRSQVVVKAAQLLTQCRNQTPMYKSMKVSSYFNVTDSISDGLHFRFHLPPKLEVYRNARIDSLHDVRLTQSFLDQLKRVENFPTIIESSDQQQTLKLLNNLNAYNLQNIMTTLKAQIFNLSLAYNLGKFSGSDVGNVKMILAKSRTLSRLISGADKHMLRQVRRTVEVLRSKMMKMIRLLPNINTAKENLLNAWSEYSDILNNTLPPRNVTFSAFETYLPPIAKYSENIRNNLEHKIGRCGVVASVYDAFYTTVCEYGTGVITALWASLAVAAGLLLGIMFCVARLVAHYRVEKDDDLLDQDVEKEARKNTAPKLENVGDISDKGDQLKEIEGDVEIAQANKNLVVNDAFAGDMLCPKVDRRAASLPIAMYAARSCFDEKPAITVVPPVQELQKERQPSRRITANVHRVGSRDSRRPSTPAADELGKVNRASIKRYLGGDEWAGTTEGICVSEDTTDDMTEGICLSEDTMDDVFDRLPVTPGDDKHADDVVSAPYQHMQPQESAMIKKDYDVDGSSSTYDHTPSFDSPRKYHKKKKKIDFKLPGMMRSSMMYYPDLPQFRESSSNTSDMASYEQLDDQQSQASELTMPSNYVATPVGDKLKPDQPGYAKRQRYDQPGFRKWVGGGETGSDKQQASGKEAQRTVPTYVRPPGVVPMCVVSAESFADVKQTPIHSFTDIKRVPLPSDSRSDLF